MLDIENTALVVVDVQGKLAQLMANRETLFANLQRMVKGAQVLRLPILWVEQNPKKLGATIPEVASLLANQSPIEKMSFGCTGCDDFNRALKSTGRQQLLVVGIEAHICVYQTAVGLAQAGYETEVVVDAIGSRVDSNRDLGIKRMEAKGVALTSIEMALFELMRTAEHPLFREIQAVVK